MSRYLLPLLLMTAPAHAASLYLCPLDKAPQAAIGAGVTAPDGARLRVLVSEAASLPGCRKLALGLDTARIEAVYPLPRDAKPEQTILLQGDDSKGALDVSEHTLIASRPEPDPPAPMPFGENLLAAMQLRSFGVEERVTATLQDGRLRIACKAGAKPAGVLLRGPWYLPRAEAALQATFSGSGAFLWQAADEARAAREGALDMGSLPAGGRLALPPGLERGAWRHFTVLCPQQAASLSLDALTLEPAAAHPAPRSTWIWSRTEWRERGQAMLDWAAGERIGEIFITVPLAEGRVAEPEALAAFIKAAGARGIAITAVEGDPHMVMPEQQAPTAARARAYADYNAQAEPAARLKGMQFDVEPYLIPAHVLPPAQRDRRYLELAARLRQAAGTMRLEFVVPFWWDSKTELLRELAQSADALSVMDYRTDPGQIYRFAVPFLDWAEAHGKQVRIALEAGPIGAETQRRYRRAAPGAAGDMLLVELDGLPVLVLLRQPAAHPKAQAFTLAGTRRIDGSATTFHGDKEALRRLLPKLEAVFGAWKGFGGMALHEWR
ncbi:hypothetical protein [Massilia sp. ST3]|uniref:hypothetical protein n=1 Tax=Massilia sp. ST3 TaxID=2824903 RepID=UPI001B812B4F|nr:hypothetical protein [Massilia sp. ST3]MBQ5948026.1 hypothetical protein [Massilia sp. ST3]